MSPQLPGSPEEKIEVIPGRNIPEVDLLPNLQPIEELISKTSEFFFKGVMRTSNFPFKGFILRGPPGTGKTEIVRQSVRRLDRRLGNVSYILVDGSTIASPRWGEAEKTLRKVFYMAQEREMGRDSKVIILFDDIESLMMARGAELAKEWHYSINSVLFHELDRLNPTHTLVAATTNRFDLVDEALATRLFGIEVPPTDINGLRAVIRDVLTQSGLKEGTVTAVEGKVMERLTELPQPTIRDARQYTVIECIESGVWSV